VGIPDAYAAYMDREIGPKGGDEERLRREESKRLIAAARRILETARGHLEAAKRGIVEAQQHLERSRNVVQAAWLLRALRRRRGRKR